MFKGVVVFGFLLCSGAAFASQIPAGIKAEVTLVHEAAILAADSNSCAVKANVLGQVSVLSRMLKTLASEDYARYGTEIYAQAVVLESYGVSLPDENPCVANSRNKITRQSFNRVEELLHNLRQTVDNR